MITQDRTSPVLAAVLIALALVGSSSQATGRTEGSVGSVPSTHESQGFRRVFRSLGEAIEAVSGPAAPVGGTLLPPADTFEQEAYLKASNTTLGWQFGYSVAISGDTAVVGSPFESSNATGVNGTSTGILSSSGAAYVFVRSAAGWSQQAYLKASNTRAAAAFGESVAISGDTIIVGSIRAAVPPSLVSTGAAYVFVRSGATWTQQALLSASNPDSGDQFGKSVAISNDTIVVGANREASADAGVDADQNDDSALEAGAAYVFARSGTAWTQQAYLKASNPDPGDFFGFSVSVSGDTVIVGAFAEDSNATGGQSDNSATLAGAAYVFNRSGTTWTQEAYLKASNTFQTHNFGYSVAISGDTLVVGSRLETSTSTGVDGDQTPNRASAVGAAYVFERTAGTWSQHTYLKASNAAQFDQFGYSVALSRNVIVVGAIEEDSGTGGVNGNQGDNSVTGAGAAYVFVRSGGTWSQHSYLKASIPGVNDSFGNAVAVSGGTIVVGANFETSSATGVNGNEADGSASQSGAAYVFDLPNTAPTISPFPITRWPATTGSFTIASVDDVEDGPGFLEVTIESANPSNGVSLSSLANIAGTVTADVAVADGASSASFLIRVTDVWGAVAETAFEVAVVPPVAITPDLTPAPNASGWHNGPVTVNWIVANSTSQSGCDTTVLSTETTGDGATFTCTAANAGGTAAGMVTIRIDLTPPVGTVSRMPLPNPNGWNNTDVDVSFTCTDALSGTVTPAASDTIDTEGAGQTRSFLCADLAGNTVPLSLTGVNIDKTAPVVVPASVTAIPNPVMVNTAVALAANLTDTGSSNLALAEFRIDAAPYAQLASPSGSSAAVTGALGAFTNAGVLDVCVRATDLAGNQSTDECVLVAVFDPNGGYVTGAGTIESPPGALAGSTATGTARFGFQSKYARGATVPSGKTQFKFRAGELEFDSTEYEWLVVAGARAQFKGTGVVRNLAGTFTFILTAIDGEQPDGGGLDRFRIKITGAGGVVYDNQMGAADNADPSTVIASGHIVIRK
jgi:hypothetical protein